MKSSLDHIVQYNKNLFQQNQLLLTLAKSLFQEQTSLDRLITNIIVEAKKMLNCERCTIFLLDLKMYDQIEQDAWNIKESLALLASTAASNSVTNVNTASGRFVPGDQTVIRKSYDILVTFLDERNKTRLVVDRDTPVNLVMEAS